MLQMGGGEENTHGSSLIVKHVWNPLCTNFSFPQAVAEDTVNTCWRDTVSEVGISPASVYDSCFLVSLFLLYRAALFKLYRVLAAHVLKVDIEWR
jgi:hypothetical protein